MEDIKDKNYPEERNNTQKVELKSPAVQEILGRPPKWIIRWGITVILIIIIGLFIGSYFFKYPDVVSSTIEVSTENLPAQLVSRATGKVDTIFVSDNEIVEKGQELAVIENPANYYDVKELQKQLDNFSVFNFEQTGNPVFKTNNNYSLGELQNNYYQFVKAFEDYEYFLQADYHNQKINALKRQIVLQEKLVLRAEKQCKFSKEQLQTQERLFSIDSSLFAKKTLSLVEYENAKNNLLNVQQSYESALTSIDNNLMTIAQHEQSIFDLRQQEKEQHKELLSALSGAYDNIQTQIHQWELQYVFESPIKGKVSLTKQWQKNQHVNAGDQFVYIVPLETTQITGKILLASQGSGKVKTGQTVNVKFDGYPYMEFGMVKGRIKNISLVPLTTDQGKFKIVEVEFPDKLKTNYNKELDFSQEMSGTAEIITEDLRLIERFLNPIKALIKNN